MGWKCCIEAYLCIKAQVLHCSQLQYWSVKHLFTFSWNGMNTAQKKRKIETCTIIFALICQITKIKQYKKLVYSLSEWVVCSTKPLLWKHQELYPSMTMTKKSFFAAWCFGNFMPMLPFCGSFQVWATDTYWLSHYCWKLILASQLAGETHLSVIGYLNVIGYLLALDSPVS